MRAWIVGIVVLGLLAGAIGWRTTQSLPEDWKSTRLGRYKQPMDITWGKATDFATWPEWNTAIASVEKLDDVRGHAVWRETWKDGETVTFEVVEHLPVRRMIRCVTDTDGPYGGCVTMEVTRRDDGSVLHIAESLRVRSQRFRLWWTPAARTQRIDTILQDLGRFFGESEIRLGSQPRDVNDKPVPAAPAEDAASAPASPH